MDISPAANTSLMANERVASTCSFRHVVLRLAARTAQFTRKAPNTYLSKTARFLVLCVCRPLWRRSGSATVEYWLWRTTGVDANDHINHTPASRAELSRAERGQPVRVLCHFNVRRPLINNRLFTTPRITHICRHHRLLFLLSAPVMRLRLNFSVSILDTPQNRCSVLYGALRNWPCSQLGPHDIRLETRLLLTSLLDVATRFFAVGSGKTSIT